MASEAMRSDSRPSPRRLGAYPALAAWCGLVAAGCSGAAGVAGPNGERLDTQVSAAQATVGDSVVVTLRVANPTGRRLALVLGSQATYAQVSHGDTTFGANVTLTGQYTISLAPGEQFALRPITLRILPPGEADSPFPSAVSEELTLSPGVYALAACAWMSGQTPEGTAFVPVCGQSVTFTVTPER